MLASVNNFFYAVALGMVIGGFNPGSTRKMNTRADEPGNQNCYDCRSELNDFLEFRTIRNSQFPALRSQKMPSS